MRRTSVHRIPIYSLLSSGIIAAALLALAASGGQIPWIAAGSLGLLSLASVMVDSMRLMKRRETRINFGAGQGGSSNDTEVAVPAAMQQWVQERLDSIHDQQQSINSTALRVQQWLQFPDALDFDRNTSPDATTRDPLRTHDQELRELIESKTKELFENIRGDVYRTQHDGRKVFDNIRIRDDLIRLASDVSAIYSPDEASPFLNTNVDALARALGRVPLRFLVAVQSLPGDLAGYDLKSIYNVVSRAVKGFGYYQSAKPYLDVASGLWAAGRVVSSSNPITFIAWWAASKATTYGASKLGQHVIDQQAVGLIRQLVEIVAVEIASIYSPMIRYRDVNWTYGVELVHLARELKVSDTARVEAMRQLAALNFKDEYGRVSLLRHLAAGTSARPAKYRPAHSLTPEQRSSVAEQLESFLLRFAMDDSQSGVDKTALDRWQAEAEDRLEIKFRAGSIDASESQQRERAAWGLVSFGLQHLALEPDQCTQRLSKSQTWRHADLETRTKWHEEILDDPPYLYHPPGLDPGGSVCRQFLADLISLAAIGRTCELDPQADALNAAHARMQWCAPVWPGEDALRVTAYFLRTDATDYLEQYWNRHVAWLTKSCDTKTLSIPLARAVEFLSSAGRPRAILLDGAVDGLGEPVHVVRFDDHLVAFAVASEAPQGVRVTMVASGQRGDVQVEKVAGYVRNDCRVTFADRTRLILPGSTLRGYDNYFRGLLEPAKSATS